MKALEVARSALGTAEALDGADFKTRVLGGPWLMKTKGIPFDAVQGFASGESAKEFCTRRAVQKTVRFDYSVYGDENCGILARAWCHRMQFAWELELSGVVALTAAFAEEHWGACEEPSEFSRIAETASGRLKGRVVQIRAVLAGT